MRKEMTKSRNWTAKTLSTVFRFPGDPTVGIRSNFYTRCTIRMGNSCSNFRKIQRCKQKLFTSVWTVQRLFLSLKIRVLRLFLDFPEIQRSESAQIFTRGSPLTWETPIKISAKSDGANRSYSLLFGLSRNLGKQKIEMLVCTSSCLQESACGAIWYNGKLKVCRVPSSTHINKKDG